MGPDSFKSALLARERDRQRLAEALDEKFQAENRIPNLVRLLTFAIFGVAAIYAAKGIFFVNEHTKVQSLSSKSEGAPQNILVEMKKQLAENDRMMIGGPISTGPVQGNRDETRSRGERGSFVQEKIPANLYGDLRKGSSRDPTKSIYGLPGPWKLKVLEELARRKAAHPPLDCGKYRPAVSTDMPKLPPKVSRIPSRPDLYVRAESAPARFAQDQREFNVSK
ncbi:MAG: hypothetical protein ACXVB9_11455 [Bdellovibrionota bacterium]